MAEDAPIARLSGMARTSRQMARRQLERIVGINRDARELFMDEKGQLKPAAERLLGQLARDAQLGIASFDPDPHHLYYQTGKRDMVLALAKMLHLDVRRLHDLQTKLEQSK